MKSFSWMNPKLEVNTGNAGKGVFAKEPCYSGEKLALTGGRIITIQEEVGDWGMQIDDDLLIGGLSKYDTELEDTHYFNHSCNPNAGIKGQILFVAMRDIQTGEEVTLDYAMCLYYGENRIDYRLDCLCGTANCRGKVTNEDWRIPELQKRYDGYFSWYLQDKINTLKAGLSSMLP